MKNLSDNIGSGKTLREAMLEEGYSPSYAESGHIKDTESWEDLLEKHLPDSVLAEKHKELLNKVEIEYQVFPKTESDKSIIETIKKFGFKVIKIKKLGNAKRAYFPILETHARRSALDMAYKLKKKYGDITIKHEFGELTDEDLEEALAKTISRISEGLANIKRNRKKKK